MKSLLALFALVPMIVSAATKTTEPSYPECQELLMSRAEAARFLKPPTPIPFNFPGLQIASVSDPTLSTGATLFLFPSGGAQAVFDARGGSVASSETTLLEEGGYSNNIDGIFMAGGSTMGLAAGDGVRAELFKKLAETAGDFDFIPSVPGAVVFDYGGRIAPFNKPLVYPDHDLGKKLYAGLDRNTFYAGRIGAGTTTTFGKIGDAYWGGQGMAEGRLGPYRVLCAVVLNASGNVFNQNGTLVGDEFYPPGRPKNIPTGAGKNTTLSVIVTDAPLTKGELKRLAVMVHTSMGAWIRPFQTATDGDILFAVSTAPPMASRNADELEMALGMKASDLMRDAIFTGIKAANYSNSESE